MSQPFTPNDLMVASDGAVDFLESQEQWCGCLPAELADVWLGIVL